MASAILRSPFSSNVNSHKPYTPYKKLAGIFFNTREVEFANMSIE